jgi:hypothetical protein
VEGLVYLELEDFIRKNDLRREGKKSTWRKNGTTEAV